MGVMGWPPALGDENTSNATGSALSIAEGAVHYVISPSHFIIGALLFSSQLWLRFSTILS